MNIREAIYATMVATGRVPTCEELASRDGVAVDLVEDAVRALAEAHVIVLEPGTTKILFAPPFSAVPTAFRVRTPDREYYAVCAWDAFGIPAALKADARIDAACAWTAEPLPCGVESGRAYGAGVIHLLVPAAHFWDDIAYT
jgi:hypothetical protein